MRPHAAHLVMVPQDTVTANTSTVESNTRHRCTRYVVTDYILITFDFVKIITSLSNVKLITR